MQKKLIISFAALLTFLTLCTQQALAIECTADNQTSVPWFVSYASRTGHGGSLDIPAKQQKHKKSQWGVSIKVVNVKRVDQDASCEDCPSVTECVFEPATPAKGQFLEVTIAPSGIIIRKRNGELLQSCK